MRVCNSNLILHPLGKNFSEIFSNAHGVFSTRSIWCKINEYVYLCIKYIKFRLIVCLLLFSYACMSIILQTHAWQRFTILFHFTKFTCLQSKGTCTRSNATGFTGCMDSSLGIKKEKKKLKKKKKHFFSFLYVQIVSKLNKSLVRIVRKKNLFKDKVHMICKCVCVSLLYQGTYRKKTTSTHFNIDESLLLFLLKKKRLTYFFLSDYYTNWIPCICHQTNFVYYVCTLHIWFSWDFQQTIIY